MIRGSNAVIKRKWLRNLQRLTWLNNALGLAKRSALRDLRNLLVTLYQDSASIRRIVDDAGIDFAEVDLGGAPNNVWHVVLLQAAKEDKIEQIIHIACQEFSNQAAALGEALQRYQGAWNPPIKLLVSVTSLILIVSSVGAVVWWYSTYVKPMSRLGRFNLAVAEIPRIDATGHQISGCLGPELSRWIYDTVLEMPNDSQQQLLTDSRGPDDIGVIYSPYPEIRHEKVAKFAEKINATIFAYGIITATTDYYQLQPEFYINSEEQSFIFGSEIAGPSRLGEPVVFSLPPDIDCANFNLQAVLDLNRQLDDRITALRYIIAGLRDFYAEEYQLAYDRFEQVTHLPSWPVDAPGQEVVQLLMGAAKLRIYQPLGDSTEAKRALQSAHTAFLRAIAINPNYARGFLGLGAVALEAAQSSEQPGEKLTEAKEWYEQSLIASDQSVHAYISAKAALGIGIAHQIGFEHQLSDWSSQQAYDQFNKVIAIYEMDNRPALLPLAAQAYANQGRLEGHNHNWQKMAELCQQAILLLEKPDVMPDRKTIARLWTWIALADEKIGKIDQALDDYQRAMAQGENFIQQPELDCWQRKIDHLHSAATTKGVTCD